MEKKTRHHNKRTFLQRISFKYRFSILNENTLEEAFHIHLSRLSVFLYVCLFAVISFAVISLLIFYTPIKHFLPGYSDASIRSDLVQKSLELDSLQTTMQFQDAQLAVIKSVLSGTIPVDSVTELDSIKLENLTKVFDVKTEAEANFCKNFEETEKYNTINVKQVPDGQMMVFMKPVNGVVGESYNLNLSFGIKIMVTPNASIKSIQNGTIISTDYTLENGYTIVVQHNDGYISVYKNITQLFKQTGDEVKSGEVTGIIEDAADIHNESYLYFEMWRNGKPLNPADYIIF
ncbi:MAG: M23 family metallopeptidase [Paludibacteraceae bacterium]|nr:M23 family metallopeptidase [Paludibacteraceae bacterium]